MSATTIRRLDLIGLCLSALGLVLALLWAFPLLWSVAATVLPHGSPMDFVRTYGYVLFETQLGRWYLNSIITSGGVTLIVLAISAACGYAISQLDFYGRKVLWIVILASFMIPVQALIVNHFFLMHQWKLINTWPGVILPQLIAPVAVIVYKQFFDSVPREFREAALIDGARHWEIFLRIYLPLNWGITTALAIIIFIGAWNAFLWPFLVVTKPEMMNVTVAATQLGMYGVDGLAAALLAGLPIAVAYLLFQRKVTEAVMMSSGIKG
ncbi:MAG: carbohydrate ABC transporter permease [Hyphomicrobiales bacterium]|nr:MAG: carbohydrate ABC transporter permease [Hyphomicrobiales bacterium]